MPTLRASAPPSRRRRARRDRSSCSSATNITASTAEEGLAMMYTADMLKAFAPHRGDAIVVAGRGGRYWLPLSDKRGLDVAMGDPAMGGHAGFGLGLALAQP